MASTLLRARRMLVAFVVTCAMAAGLMAAATPSSALTPSANMAYAIGGELYKLLNVERASVGRPPLRPNVHLVASAYGHNLKMAAYNTMSHSLPGELSLGGRIMRAGYLPWRTVGENIAWSTDWTLTGAQNLERMMFNEVAPYNSHRLNIISTAYADLGINVYMDGVHHKMWITMDFGHLA